MTPLNSKSFRISLLMPLFLTSCNSINKFAQEQAGFINKYHGAFYAFREDRSSINLIENHKRVENVNEIEHDHEFLLFSIDVTKTREYLTVDVLNGFYGLLKEERHTWIAFYGASDFSFLTNSLFDNEKHYHDSSTALTAWYNDGKSDYVNTFGYRSKPSEYTDDFFVQTMFGFYANAIREVVGSN